jgi:hypothetical protein
LDENDAKQTEKRLSNLVNAPDSTVDAPRVFDTPAVEAAKAGSEKAPTTVTR